MSGGSQCDPIAESVAALADIPVGPALAAAVASLDLSLLTGSQCMDVLQAHQRQDNHQRAALFAVVSEVMHRGEADTSVLEEYPGEFAADEVRAALVLTRRAAESLCSFAVDVVRRLPAVQAAFAAGLIDQPRVWVFSHWTGGLPDEHTQAIVAVLLPRAPQLTTAQLIGEIQRHAIALDPDWARRRYEAALSGRKVVGSRNKDGTANLSGYNLPADQVAAACDRLDRLAKAAKQAGHSDPIDHLRAGLFLAMTDGTYEGLTDRQILARLLTDANLTPPTHPTDPEHTAGDAPPADDSSTEDGSGDGPRPHGPSSSETDPGNGDGDGDGENAAAGGVGGGQTAGLRLLVRLATIAGADQRPGELIGWGPVHAELARTIAATPGASWWYVLTDGATPLAIGQVRARPAGVLRRRCGDRGPEVWLQVTREGLNALAEQDLPPGWTEILAEIRGKAETDPGPPKGDRRKRLPGAALRRWIAVRDKTCVFPGCRVPAHRSDADHSIEHAQGGQTTDTNLGPGCRHDHRIRHEGGWTLTQPTPGQFTWTSRLGRTYHRLRPPDLDDLPDPMLTPPSANEPDVEYARPSTEDWQNDTCMEPEPPQPPPDPPPPPQIPPEDDPPPF